MRVVSEYSHKDGKQYIERNFRDKLSEVYEVIGDIDLEVFRTKESKEKTMRGRMLYDPTSLNHAFKKSLMELGWAPYKHKLDFDSRNYREMDFVKDKLGVEVQLGKYAFMAYNVSAKMTIFHNLGIIDAGIEIVPMKRMADDMSTGVSYFQQIEWDLKNRGEADIDIPVIVMGIDRD